MIVIKKTYKKGGSEEYNFRNLKDVNKAFNFNATEIVSLKELLAAKKDAEYEIWLEAPNIFAGNEGERYLGTF